MQGNDEAKRLQCVSILTSITLSFQTLDELIKKNQSNQLLLEKRDDFLKKFKDIGGLYRKNQNLDEYIKNLQNLSLVISRKMPFITLKAQISSIYGEVNDHVKTIEYPKAQKLLQEIQKVASSIKKLDHHIFDTNVGRV